MTRHGSTVDEKQIAAKAPGYKEKHLINVKLYVWMAKLFWPRLRPINF
jgi:hypothetical protein